MQEERQGGLRVAVAAASNVLDKLQRLLVVAVTLILSISALLLLWQVVDRLALGGGQNWIDEYARLSLVWMTFLGSAALLREGKSLTVEYFVDRIGERGRRVIGQFVDLLVLALMVFLMLQIPVVWKSSAALVSPSLGIPRTVLASAAFVGFGISSLYLLESIARRALKMPELRPFTSVEYSDIPEEVEDSGLPQKQE